MRRDTDKVIDPIFFMTPEEVRLTQAARNKPVSMNVSQGDDMDIDVYIHINLRRILGWFFK